MNSEIELHDSECVSIEQDQQGNGTVILSAYVHRYECALGEAPHEGGEQRIRMTIDSIAVSGEVGELPATIYDGSLTVGPSRLGLIPFPARHEGSVTLTMILSDDARQVEMTGIAIEIFSESTFRFIERVDFTRPAAPAPPRS